MARKLRVLAYPVTGIWVLLCLIALVVVMVLPNGLSATVQRGVGWMLFFLPVIPGALLHGIAWVLPRVRVWSCTCGRRNEVKLER